MNAKEYTTFATGKRPPSKKEFLMNIEEKQRKKKRFIFTIFDSGLV